MKKLQNNFTTPDQSKRLLELGVPADSADCYLLRAKHTATFYPHVLINETYTQKDKFLNVLDYLPCWSVGRLSEIFTTCAEYYTGDNSLVFNRESVSLGNINCLIPVIELAVKDKCIYFSKLED